MLGGEVEVDAAIDLRFFCGLGTERGELALEAMMLVEPVALGGGYYKFVGRASGRCLDVPSGSGSTGVQLQIYDCNGTGSQAFRFQLNP